MIDRGKRMKKVATFLIAVCTTFLAAGCAAAQNKGNNAPPPQAPFTDYRYEKPGATHHITAKDLPAPFATKSATNGPRVVDRPANIVPIAPPGFKVELFATGFNEPRAMITAPNGDIFLAESHPGDIKVF